MGVHCHVNLTLSIIGNKNYRELCSHFILLLNIKMFAAIITGNETAIMMIIKQVAFIELHILFSYVCWNLQDFKSLCAKVFI